MYSKSMQIILGDAYLTQIRLVCVPSSFISIAPLGNSCLSLFLPVKIALACTHVVQQHALCKLSFCLDARVLYILHMYSTINEETLTLSKTFQMKVAWEVALQCVLQVTKMLKNEILHSHGEIYGCKCKANTRVPNVLAKTYHEVHVTNMLCPAYPIYCTTVTEFVWTLYHGGGYYGRYTCVYKLGKKPERTYESIVKQPKLSKSCTV